MINSTEINKSNTTRYPWIGEHIGLGLVVLFTSPQSGVSIKNRLIPNLVGEYETNWSEGAYTTYTGVLELSNK